MTNYEDEEQWLPHKQRSRKQTDFDRKGKKGKKNNSSGKRDDIRKERRMKEKLRNELYID